MRVTGTRHSFSEIADTDGTQLNLEYLRKIEVDKEAQTVTFGAGVTYTMLLEALVKEQMAIENLPSLPHINVVGSVVTGTHGGGIGNQALANYVTQMRMIDPNGEVKVVNEDTPDFKRYIHSFGLMGVIVEMTMKIEPEYAVIKCIYEDLSWDFL